MRLTLCGLMSKSENGYPNPGRQEISVHDIMTNLYFETDAQWEIDRTSGDFDYVIVGSSFCALGFTHQMLKNNPTVKILIIDRGDYFINEHLQNLPPAYSRTVRSESETFHWKITDETYNGEYIHYQHGMFNFFGGRSSFWTTWCPEPTDDEMVDWPQEVIEKVHEYFPAAKDLLHVVPANEISASGKDPENKIFGELQTALYEALKDIPSKMDTITRVLHAPLAVKADKYRYVG